MIIDSPSLGAFVDEQINLALNEKTFEVILDEQDRLRWVDRSGAEEIVIDTEPQTT